MDKIRANRVIPEKIATHYPFALSLMSISKEFDMYCKCDCGQVTNIARFTRTERGWIKGRHKPYIYRHYKRDLNKPIDMLGKGITSTGYEYTMNHGLVHRLKVEKILGRLLPEGAIVHHHDGNRAYNRNKNLVVCQDKAYHNLLHQRIRAYETCGNANHRKCTICKEYDDINNMKNYSHHNNNFFHIECSRIKARKQHRDKKYAANFD